MRSDQIADLHDDISQNFLEDTYLSKKLQNLLNEDNQSILANQYFELINNHLIISKADLDGNITYVNEKFVDISGYSKKELIGKNHNIVRDPQNSENTFKSLWYTIKFLKMTWIGEIKNKRKDGTSYYVKGFIKPILDENNEIIEYISIRIDITNEIEIKDYFKSQLNITSNNFNSMMHLQKEYQKITDQNNIIVRTNIKNQITYANENFLNLFKVDESIYNKSISDLIYNLEILEINQTLKNTSSYDSILNTRDTYLSQLWLKVSANIVKAINGDVIEYMYIFQDVTQIYQLHHEVEETQKEMIYIIGEIAEQRSLETGKHTKRVAFYSRLLAKLYGLNKKDIKTIFVAAPMHDIGKITVPDKILKKNGKLTIEEFNEMRKHTLIGKEILENSTKEITRACGEIAYTHHEKWDGSGYPQGLSKKQIPIFGRIVAIADVFDALSSVRYYKEAWQDNEIFEYFEAESGKSFDPDLVNLFLGNKNKFIKIRNKFQ